MVLPLLGTRRPDSLPVEALEGSDDMAILPCRIAAHCCLQSGRYRGVCWAKEEEMRQRDDDVCTKCYKPSSQEVEALTWGWLMTRGKYLCGRTCLLSCLPISQLRHLPRPSLVKLLHFLQTSQGILSPVKQYGLILSGEPIPKKKGYRKRPMQEICKTYAPTLPRSPRQDQQKDQRNQ